MIINTLQGQEYAKNCMLNVLPGNMGITSIGKNKAGVLVNIPEEFQAFTNMFAMEYDRIKGELANPDSSSLDLKSYLKIVHAYCQLQMVGCGMRQMWVLITK